MSSSNFKDIPEAYEVESGETLQFRTDALASYRELGPPDLCIVSKIIDVGKRTEKEESSVHHILGVDSSSSASLAAYINSLTYSIEEVSGWFGKGSSWKIQNGTYCCYNAFSRRDIRVQIRIPGGVDAYVVTPQGDRLEPDEQEWIECGLSAALRAITYSEEEGYLLPILRRLPPIPNLKHEIRFLNSVSSLFWKGWQLGSNSETQIATHTCNHLIDALEKYFYGAKKHEKLAAFLVPFAEKEPEVYSIIAQAQISGNMETDAIKTLYSSIKRLPASHRLLVVQAKFLLAKGELDAALIIAEQAVRLAPSEFIPWSILVEVLIAKKNYIQALLTLNSCPMFTFSEMEFPRVPPFKSISQPIRNDASVGYDLGDVSSPVVASSSTPTLATPTNPSKSFSSERMSLAAEIQTNEKSGLLKLPAKGLKGTFKKAYQLLTSIVDEIGWDELLRLRSSAFVMEEEYRSNTTTDPSSTPQLPLTDESHVLPSNLESIPEIDNENHSASSATNTELDVNQTSAISTESPSTTVNKPESPLVNDPKISSPDMSNSISEPVGSEIISNDNASENASISEAQPSSSLNDTETQLQEGFTSISLDDENKPEPIQKLSESESIPEIADVSSNIESNDATMPSESTSTEILAENSESIEPANSGEKPEDSNAIVESENSAATATATASTETVEETSSLPDQPDAQENSGAANASEAVESTESTESTQAAEVGTAKKGKKNKKNKKGSKIPQNDGADEDSYITASTNDNDGLESISSADDKPDIDSEFSGPKRLCERWLDNLFMVLYEDLRIYTMWRTEMYHLKATGKPILARHTQLEWEALGDVSFRLNHFEESKSAFTMSIEYRFSFHSWIQLLTLHSKPLTSDSSIEDDSTNLGLVKPYSDSEFKESLDAIIWIIVYMDRWYNDSIYPTFVCEQILSLIDKYGLSKVQNTIISMNLKPLVFKLASKYISYSQEFQTSGYNW
ncbi:hypothetical protein AYI69_g6842 [Smittium culicis]|uniref:Uncharacterized protein n=1 Tax=Smittium culicis TaxID=133412 RepID=A0A1R1XW45_9FUNG|nr:hypothetical protein AYI69_g6842 [Smittium culicis]